MSKKRRTHAPALKAKVALAAVRGDHSLAELAQQYQVHPNQIQKWKKQLLNNAQDVFENGSCILFFSGCKRNGTTIDRRTSWRIFIEPHK